MKIPALPFTVTDWSQVDATTHAGESGQAFWRTLDIGDVRVRMSSTRPDISLTTGVTVDTCFMCWKASSKPNCATAAASRCDQE